MSKPKTWSDEVIQHLLIAPNDQLDTTMLPLIRKWNSTPTALQVLEVLDQCIMASLASGIVIRLLTLLFNEAVENENTTEEAVFEKAEWRKR